MNPTSPFTMPWSLPTEPVNQESAIVSPEQLRSHLEPSVGQQPQAPVEEKKNFWSFQKDASSKKWINFSLQIMTATTWWLILLVIGLLFFFLTKVNIRWSSNCSGINLCIILLLYEGAYANNQIQCWFNMARQFIPQPL